MAELTLDTKLRIYKGRIYMEQRDHKIAMRGNVIKKRMKRSQLNKSVNPEP